MLYRFLRLVVPYVVRAHFNNVFIDGVENVPKTGPVIIASSHPNSFLDAVLLAILLDRPLHFLVRADVFKRPLIARLLKAMHQLPVYRSDSGREGLTSGNASTFAQCHRLLKKNGTILIFSEGTTIQDKQLRPLRKGTARLAFSALDELPADTELHVLPVAVNYTHHVEPGAEVMIGIGQPVAVRQWLNGKDKTQPATLRQFSEELLEHMQAQHISVANSSTATTVENALNILRGSAPYHTHLGYGIPSNGRLKAEQHMAVYIERLAANEPLKYERLQHSMSDYFKALEQEQLTPYAPAEPGAPVPHPMLPGTGLLAVLTGILHLPPRLSGFAIGKRTAADTIFQDSVSAGSSLVLYLLYFPLLLFLGYWLLGWWGIGATLLLFIGGWYDIRATVKSLYNGFHKRWQGLHKTAPSSYHALRIQHKKLLQQLNLEAEDV